jgi:hypothetical protein
MNKAVLIQRLHSARAVLIQRLHTARVDSPYPLSFALLFPIPGVLAIVHGDRVSQALSNITAIYISRGMGVALFAGSVLVLVGIIRNRALIKAVGLGIMAAGCAVYGLGVVLGLGLAGAVAGTMGVAIATGSVLRIISLTTAARTVDQTKNS